MLTENKVYDVEIVDIGHKGEAIGKSDGFTVFVDGAIKGDIVKAKIVKSKKNYAVGDLVEIVKPSPFRVQPKCDLTGICGGCSIMSLDYEKQLELKQNIVVENLKRIAKIENPNVEKIVGMKEPYYYRNKGVFPITKNNNAVEIGFYKKRSHDIVEFEECKIQHQSTKAILDEIKKFTVEKNTPIYVENMPSPKSKNKREKAINGIRRVMIRNAFANDEIMVVIVTSDENNYHLDELAKRLVEVNSNIKSIIQNINNTEGNKILSSKNKIIFGDEKIIDQIHDLKFEISPNSFYQVNPVQTDVMYSKALEYANLTGKEIVFDIYCGIGTISLFLSKKAKKIYGIEIIPEAIEDANKNAKLNNIDNIEFIVGKAEEDIVKLYEKGIIADTIVVDPPRKGIEEIVLQTIAKMNVKRVVYVSCNPSTMSRDIEILSKYGYVLEECTPVDNFPHSMHVETVCLLTRKDVKKHFRFELDVSGLKKKSERADLLAN